MTPHPLVQQLHFARSEFARALAGITDIEARVRFQPMNCLGWNIGHLAWQEQRYWLLAGQDRVLLPEIAERFAYGSPACAPALDEVWGAWHAITAAADPWLDALTTAKLQEIRALANGDQRFEFTFGSLLLRTTDHYWYHTGENMAIRQLLGHRDLPEFVGDIDDEAPYRPE